MSDELARYYLQNMGIDVWLARQKNASCKEQLSLLSQEVASCKRCVLHKTRCKTVFSRGSSEAKLMVIGEAPGFYEDKQGLPFVGKAGSLLNQMLYSIGIDEEKVYIANVLKCRPPDNRDPTVDEINQCRSYLNQQIDFVNPRLILALGRFAGQFLLNKPVVLNQLREKIYAYKNIPF